MSTDSDHDYRCPEHGPVSPTDRPHGGRAHAFVCPEDGCGHTVTKTTVDWDAYHDARENDECPPCPRCESDDINEVPASPPFRCRDCSHAFGYAGVYPNRSEALRDAVRDLVNSAGGHDA